MTQEQWDNAVSLVFLYWVYCACIGLSWTIPALCKRFGLLRARVASIMGL